MSTIESVPAQGSTAPNMSAGMKPAIPRVHRHAPVQEIAQLQRRGAALDQEVCQWRQLVGPRGAVSVSSAAQAATAGATSSSRAADCSAADSRASSVGADGARHAHARCTRAPRSRAASAANHCRGACRARACSAAGRGRRRWRWACHEVWLIPQRLNELQQIEVQLVVGGAAQGVDGVLADCSRG